LGLGAGAASYTGREFWVNHFSVPLYVDAIARGGLPVAKQMRLPRGLSAAYYLLDSVAANDGETPHTVTVKDVPVDAFWSITVYNADGYLEKNDLGRNSFNNSSAKPNEDGSYTIRFGGDPKSENYLPITEGWNYAIRMYQPREEILDGSWKFPAIEPVK